MKENAHKYSLLHKWKSLSKGSKIAICLISGVCVTTIITVPTVIAIDNANSLYLFTLDEVTKSLVNEIKLKKNSNGDYVGNITPKNKDSIIRIDQINVGSKQLEEDKDYQYKSKVLTIYKSVIGEKKEKVYIKLREVSLSDKKISIESNTLKINKKEVSPKDDLDLIISLSSSVETLRLPSVLPQVLVDGMPFSKYTYNSTTGEFHIDKDYIIGDILIIAEATDITKEGFKVTFEIDDGCEVYVYEDQDYTKTPIKNNVAYSYDVKKKKYVKDGEGQINFKVSLKDNKEINYIWPKGIYKNLKQINDNNVTDIYRLTQICGDINIKITTTNRYVKDFSCIGDTNNKTFTLGWNVRNSDNITSTNLTIKHKESIETIPLEGSTNTYIVNNVSNDDLYTFEISPISDQGNITSLTTTKMLSNVGHEVSFPRLEITTESGVYPTINKVASWDIYTLGFHEGRDPYVNSLVELYNGKTKLYSSSLEGNYDKAKIKVRGNGSVLHYNNKQPLKLKLTDASDILDTLRKYPKKEGINYANKDWVLLPYCPNMFDLVGYTTESTFNFDYCHDYTYITLYINNDYQGLYTLVEVNNEGIGDYEEQSRYKVDTNGFLIENDYYHYKEDVAFPSIISSNQNQNVFTYPDLKDKKAEYPTYVEEIKSYFDKMENAIKNNDSNLFNDYLDIDSFAKWLVNYDVIGQSDADGANRFLIKHNKDSKVYMGTPWDYEYLMNTFPHTPKDVREVKEFYYYYLVNRNDFKEAIKTCFNKNKSNVLKNINDAIDKIKEEDFNTLINYEEIRHNLKYKNYKDSKDDIKEYFENRIKELEDKY